MYLYLINVSPNQKEIKITRSERLLWNLIPFDPLAFDEVVKIYADYKIIELDEKNYRGRDEGHDFLYPDLEEKNE